MTAGDINQITIAGHIEQPPWMMHDEDGDEVCEFLLSHAPAASTPSTANGICSTTRSRSTASQPACSSTPTSPAR